MMNSESSFTLIELLIVIGVIAVLAVVAVLVLNPLELLKQARDTQRIADLATINKALAVYQSSGQINLGTANTVYVSIPSNQANCSDLGLPALPSGYTYACVTSSTLQKTDGTGWIPLVFSAVSYGTPLEKLPVDPINSTTTKNYYTYVSGGSWELTSLLESQKYLPKAINDGDSYPGVYSVRTSNTPLTPGIRDYGLVGYWKFDEGTGTTTNDSSGNNTIGSWSGASAYSSGKVGPYSADVNNGSSGYIETPSAPPVFDTGTAVTISVWLYRRTNAVSYGSIVNHIYKTSPYDGYWIGSMSNGKLMAFIGPYTNALYSTNVITNNEWHNAVLVSNDSAFSMYIDGASAAGSLSVGSITHTNQTVRIGKSVAAGESFDGLIDDVRIYNRALSAAEVAAIYNTTK